MSENKKVIYIVGMGPGSISGMSGDAVEALHKSDMIIGYTVYVDLVKQRYPGKEFLTASISQIRNLRRPLCVRRSNAVAYVSTMPWKKSR